MNLPCIKCGKPIKLWDSQLNQWKDGVVGTIEGSLYSRFYKDKFTVAICDNCIIDVYYQKTNP